MTERSLPDSWTMVPLAAVGEWRGGGTPSKGDPSYWNGNIPWASPKDMKVYRLRETADFITQVAVERSATTLIPENSVVIVARSGILAHTLPVATTDIALAINQDLKAVTPYHGIDPEYLAWAIRAEQQSILSQCSKDGTTVHSIEMPSLYAFHMPLAPYREQRRIVAKIEELFSELDSGVSSLQLGRIGLEAYREALLTSAFTGRLTATWRQENTEDLPTSAAIHAIIAERRGGFTPIARDELRTQPTLPEGWLWVRGADVLAEPLANGRSVKDRSGGFPVLRLTAIGGGAISLSETKEGDWNREAASPFLVREADFLVARGNGSKRLVGRGGLVPEVTDEVAYPDTMIRLRTDSDIIRPEFLALAWESRLLRQQIEDAARTTAGIYKINQQHILNFMIPVCGRLEQREVLRILDSCLTSSDRLRADVDAEIARGNALRQAILKKAFSGQLVEQNAKDEPASVLLERIASENGHTAEEDDASRTERRRRRTGT